MLTRIAVPASGRFFAALLVVSLLAGCAGAATPAAPVAATLPATAAPSATALASAPGPATSLDSALPAGVPAPVPVTVNGGGKYEDIAPAALAVLLPHKDFPLINVHIPYEGEIANTDAFIPYDQITANLAELPADKNAPVVLYCRSGNMSTQAAQELAKLGYTHIYNLAGGMNAWKAAGQQILDKPQ
jgi:phage shock protein E